MKFVLNYSKVIVRLDILNYFKKCTMSSVPIYYTLQSLNSPPPFPKETNFFTIWVEFKILFWGWWIETLVLTFFTFEVKARTR